MLLIGNGCFGELSIILRVTMVCVFFHSIYNNISTGINCPGVSCEYDTYLILLNMYVHFGVLVYTPIHRNTKDIWNIHRTTGKRKNEYPTTHLRKLIGNMTPHAYPQHIHKLFTDRHLHLQRSR